MLAERRARGRFLVGFVLLWGVLAGLSEIYATGRWGLVILAAVAVMAVTVEMVFFRTPTRQAVADLGLGRPRARALVVAAAVSGLVLLVFPLTATVTGAQLRLVPGWGWILLGLFAFHGLAEEMVWRGYAFRRLNVGRSFGRGVLWTMPLIAATHVPIVLNSGLVVGLGAVLVAAVTSLPLSHLYRMGGGTIWAPALVHTAIDSFKLVIIPTAAVGTFSLLLIGVSLVIPLLALVAPRRPLCPVGVVQSSSPGR